MKKKVLSCVLSAAFALALVPTAAFAAGSNISVNDEKIVITTTDYGKDVVITCQGKVTENEEVVIDGEQKTVTRIELKPGSTISVASDGEDTYCGFACYWTYFSSLEAYGYASYDYYLWNSVVDERFGIFDVEGEERIEVKAYLCDSYWFVLDDGQSSATTTPATPGSYTAVQYDTWGQIALNNYGTYGVWKQLYKANNYAKLTKGAVINLPEKLGKYSRIEAPVAAEGETLYTVKAGDTLGSIAKATYGDAMQYKAIFERNSDRLKNANSIYEGQVIVLPAK